MKPGTSARGPGGRRRRGAGADRTGRPRVLLADDHELLLDAFEKLLEPECRVVGRVADGRALLRAARELRPDVIVLDIGMPSLNGLDAGQRVKAMLPSTRLVFLTVSEDPDLAAEAFRVGGSAYILKKSAASELFTAIREVIRGRPYITPLIDTERVTSFMLGGGRRRPATMLTARQREILQLLAEGRTMKQVASVLHLAPRTIAFHKYRMMRDLGIKSNAELIQFAVRTRIVTSGG